MADATSDIATDPTALYTQLDAYPWDVDVEFQGGLRAILGSVNEPSQVAHLTLRAKCYYYARKAGTTVDFDGYKRWVEGRNGSVGEIHHGIESEPSIMNSASQDEPLDGIVTSSEGNGIADAPKPATFAEICDMIAEGKPIPGIKDIPDTILEGQASDSNRAQRKKPWERDELRTTATPSWIS